MSQSPSAPTVTQIPLDITAIYRHLSRKFNDGSEGCPDQKSMGECPCLEQMDDKANSYRAYLYIWPAGFHLTAAQVAGWFTEVGAQEVFISHVLHDPWNDTFEGSCNDGAKNWLVEFAACPPKRFKPISRRTCGPCG